MIRRLGVRCGKWTTIFPIIKIRRFRLASSSHFSRRSQFQSEWKCHPQHPLARQQQQPTNFSFFLSHIFGVDVGTGKISCGNYDRRRHYTTTEDEWWKKIVPRQVFTRQPNLIAPTEWIIIVYLSIFVHFSHSLSPVSCHILWSVEKSV